MVQKVSVKDEFEAGLRHGMTGKLCLPSSKWVSYSNWGRIRQRKEMDGLPLSSAMPKIQWDSNPPLIWLLDYGKPLPLPAEHEILNAHKLKISRNSAFSGSDKPMILFFLLS